MLQAGGGANFTKLRTEADLVEEVRVPHRYRIVQKISSKIC
jgi:hypothetical protein